MKTHTTYTEIVRIAKYAKQGYSPEDISITMKTDLEEVKRIIAVKCPAEKAKPKARAKAAKPESVDPLS